MNRAERRKAQREGKKVKAEPVLLMKPRRLERRLLKELVERQ